MREAHVRCALYAALLATSLGSAVSAQTLWSGAQEDVCEVWNNGQIRCHWQPTDRAPDSIRVTLTNMTEHYVIAQVGFWQSACGDTGRKSKDDTLKLAPGATLTALALYTPEHGTFCHEVRVTCEPKRCSDVLEVSAGSSRGP